jgi:hypothetical protein
VNARIDGANRLGDDSHSPPLRVHQRVPAEPTSEDFAIMPIEGRAQDVSREPAHYTITGERGMLVLQTHEPDGIQVSPGEGTRIIRLSAIVGVAMLIVGGLVWLQVGVNFATPSNQTRTQVANAAEDDTRSTTIVTTPGAGNNRAGTIEKPTATMPSPSAAAVTPATAAPMQIAKTGAKEETRPTTTVASPENDRGGTIGKQPAVAVPSGGMTKPTSESAALAPGASGPVSRPAPLRELDSNEVAMLIRRGKQFLADGDLTSARLLLQRAATAGSAEATFLVGTTFDPSLMRRVGVLGIELNSARAREWYARAAELGSSEALERLASRPGGVH